MGTAKRAGSPGWSLPEVGAASGPSLAVWEAGHALRAGRGALGLGTGGRGWRDSTEPDPGLLLIRRPAVSRRCLRRTGGVATTDRSGQRGHGSPQGLRAPGECGRRRALGWRFAVERISPCQAGEGRRPCALGRVCGSRSPWPVRPSRRKTGSTGPLCYVTAPAQELLWTGAGPA